jgi:hypothetical protein
MVTGVEIVGLPLERPNKLLVRLQYVPFDFDKRTADFSKRAWTNDADAKETPNKTTWFTSDPDGKVAENSGRGRVTIGGFIPDPPSPITGVMLDNTEEGNIGLKGWVKTDFYGPDKPTQKIA